MPVSITGVKINKKVWFQKYCFPLLNLSAWTIQSSMNKSCLVDNNNYFLFLNSWHTFCTEHIQTTRER